MMFKANERFMFEKCFYLLQTYVNDCRIQDQEYVTLKHMDSVRLGSDILPYVSRLHQIDLYDLLIQNEMLYSFFYYCHSLRAHYI